MCASEVGIGQSEKRRIIGREFSPKTFCIILTAWDWCVGGGGGGCVQMPIHILDGGEKFRLPVRGRGWAALRYRRLPARLTAWQGCRAVLFEPLLGHRKSQASTVPLPSSRCEKGGETTQLQGIPSGFELEMEIFGVLSYRHISGFISFIIMFLKDTLNNSISGPNPEGISCRKSTKFAATKLLPSASERSQTFFVPDEA